MSGHAEDDDTIRSLVRGSALLVDTLTENEDSFRLGAFGILKRRASYNNGWTWNLRPDSRFYKRWFDFPDLERRGWAIIFRIFDPVGEPTETYEQLACWVRPEHEQDADRWIEFLNAEIRDRLQGIKHPEVPHSTKPGGGHR